MTQAVGIKVLAALIALQVGVGGVALATVEDTPSTTAVESSATTTTTPGDASVPGGTPVPGGPSEQPAPAPGQPGSAPAAGGATAPPAGAADLNALPERPSPTRPGQYTYKTKSDANATAGTFTTQINDERDVNVRYESVPPANGEQRDREKTESSGSSGGFNFSGNSDRERAWRSNGVFTTSESGGGSSDGGEEISGSCDWDPDVQDLAFPLRDGASWTWDSKCDMRSENMSGTQTWRGEARVTGVETASVGGREVRVLVIERRSEKVSDVTYRQEGRESKGRSTFQETTRQLFAPSVSLTVRSDTDFKGTFEGGQPGASGRFEGKTETELVSLDPK